MAIKTFRALYAHMGFKFELEFYPNGLGYIGFPPNSDLGNEAFMSALREVQVLHKTLEPYCELHQIASKYGLKGNFHRAKRDEIAYMCQLLEKAKTLDIDLKSDYVKLFMAWIEQNPQSPAAPEKPKPKDGYVYLVQSPTGAYKIGRTMNPQNRLKTFHVKLPFEVDFVALIPTEDSWKLESELHGKFYKKRIRGEWFNLSPEDVEYIKSLAEQKAA